MPGAAFEVGAAERGPSIDVTDDVSGAQALDVTPELQEGAENCLVDVTNRLGQDVTVTVSLRDGSDGNLTVVDGASGGNTVEFALAEGVTRTVEMNTDAGTAGNTTHFDVRSTGKGVYAETLNRSAPITDAASTSCA